MWNKYAVYIKKPAFSPHPSHLLSQPLPNPPPDQAGPAGILSAQEVFSPIHNTLRQVFKREAPQTRHLSHHALLANRHLSESATCLKF